MRYIFMMTEKAKAARRIAEQAAREADPEQTRRKARERAKRYRDKHPERVREYQRQWRAKNPDKVKQYFETYWERQAEKAVEKLRSINEEKGNECKTTKA